MDPDPAFEINPDPTGYRYEPNLITVKQFSELYRMLAIQIRIYFFSLRNSIEYQKWYRYIRLRLHTGFNTLMLCATPSRQEMSLSVYVKQ